MIGLILITTLFILGLVLLDSISNVKEITENWPKYRCRINIMPFASLYGFDPQENFNFCLQNSLQKEAGPLLTPVFTILATLMGTIGVLMSTLNSIRVSFATFMGGVNLMFQNFTDRIIQLTYRLRMSAARMKALMARIYGTFFALIYAGVSGMQALNNFGNTFLFRFLDTFCFDPDTLVEIEGKGSIPIREVKHGDIFERTKGRVSAVFEFLGDGQAMVSLGGTTVSTNHFVLHEGKWIRAEEHPDAFLTRDWDGGKERPLICLNTSDHQIPIGAYMFRDYDETETEDLKTMQFIEQTVNAGTPSQTTQSYGYSNCVAIKTRILMKDGTEKRAYNIVLGDETRNGKVIGWVDKEIQQICKLPYGEKVGAGTLIYHEKQWVRAGSIYPVLQASEPIVYRNLILTPSAILETPSGLAFRDYMELHSQEAEQFYDSALRSS